MALYEVIGDLLLTILVIIVGVIAAWFMLWYVRFAAREGGYKFKFIAFERMTEEEWLEKVKEDEENAKWKAEQKEKLRQDVEKDMKKSKGK